ncbi:hypothetical protein C0Q70_06350 [Pomacea canaliculata]|uniref:C2H2-type domain-containing protein n=1 Tax=Pomacea canaliculata TaxID=400727 RepID=A0A2T7PNS0_POMCA|nr:hypothetical protein C0Q70_06350 [Pomacea canaliculata]
MPACNPDRVKRTEGGQEVWPHGRQLLYSSCRTEHAQWPQNSSFDKPSISHGASGAADDSAGLVIADTDLAQQVSAALPNKSSAAGISGSTFSVENLLKTDKKPQKGLDARRQRTQYNWPAYKPPHDLLTLTTDPPFVTPNLQGYQTQFSPAALPSSHPMANSCFLPARPSQIQFTSEHQGHVIASSGTSSPCSPPQTPVDNHQQRRVSSVAPTVDPEDAAVRTSRHTVLLEGKGHADGEKSEGHDEDGEEKEAKGQDITMKIENDKTTQNSSLLKPDEALDHLSHVISTYAPNVNLCPSLVKTVSSVKDGFVGVINSGLGIVNPNYTRSFIPPSDSNKPYACPITPCTKTCAQRVTLENHLEKIHGIKTPYEKKERRPKVYVCELCQTTYHTRHEVVEHTKTNHPNDPCLQRLHDRRHFGAEEGSGSSQNQPKARRRTGRQRKMWPDTHEVFARNVDSGDHLQLIHEMKNLDVKLSKNCNNYLLHSPRGGEAHQDHPPRRTLPAEAARSTPFWRRGRLEPKSHLRPDRQKKKKERSLDGPAD